MRRAGTFFKENNPMIRQTLTLAALAASFAWAQQPAGTPASGAAPASGHSHSGILMDASCAAITSASSASSYTAPGTTPTAATTPRTPTDTATAAGTATPSPTTGVTQAGTTHSGTHAGTTDALGQTRVTDRANQTQMPRTTAQAAERNDPATGIAGRGTGAGTSTAPQAGQPNIDATGPQSTVASSGTTPGAVAEGSRARTEMVPTTVREKYKDCKVTANTTRFAIYSNGKITMLDDASNTMVRDKLAGNTRVAGSEWMSVTMGGSIEGDRLKVSTFDPNK